MQDLKTKYDAAVIANWLIKCIQCNHEVDYCQYCPFGEDEGDCLDNIHIAAAQMLRKLANIK